MKRHRLLAVATIVGSTIGAAALGGARPSSWYRRLRKPAFTPPPAAFPVVWTALYALQAASAYRVWRAPKSADRTKALALWAAQLGFNAAWSPLFFGAHAPRAALVDLAALDGTLAAYVRRAAKVDRPAAWLASPYLAWVLFATAINERVVRLNPT